MSSIWPIYVPTKGRAGTSKFLALAVNTGLPVIMVVEPQEAEAYRMHYPGVPYCVLPANDRGITFARNEIIKSARYAGHEWIWMIDDDVSNLYRVIGGKCIADPLPAGVLHEAQGYAAPSVGQLALEYRQFAWAARQPLKFNSYADVVVAVRIDGAPTYQDNTKEDRDFTMQVIASGRDVVRVCNLAFGAPANGSNKGGLHADYAGGKEPIWARNLAARWPWCVTVQTKPNGRVDAKIDWKSVRRRPHAT